MLDDKSAVWLHEDLGPECDLFSEVVDCNCEPS